jgi:hypothetical protein
MSIWQAHDRKVAAQRAHIFRAIRRAYRSGRARGFWRGFIVGAAVAVAIVFARQHLLPLLIW